MEKPDAKYQDRSSPETLTPNGHHDMEYGNGTALTARQKLNPQPTDDPNDPVRNLIKARRVLTNIPAVELAIVVKVCDLVAGLFAGCYWWLEHSCYQPSLLEARSGAWGV